MHPSTLTPFFVVSYVSAARFPHSTAGGNTTTNPDTNHFIYNYQTGIGLAYLAGIFALAFAAILVQKKKTAAGYNHIHGFTQPRYAPVPQQQTVYYAGQTPVPHSYVPPAVIPS